jgi:hypothetical protein
VDVLMASATSSKVILDYTGLSLSSIIASHEGWFLLSC